MVDVVGVQESVIGYRGTRFAHIAPNEHPVVVAIAVDACLPSRLVDPLSIRTPGDNPDVK